MLKIWGSWPLDYAHVSWVSGHGDLTAVKRGKSRNRVVLTEHFSSSSSSSWSNKQHYPSSGQREGALLRSGVVFTYIVTSTFLHNRAFCMFDTTVTMVVVSKQSVTWRAQTSSARKADHNRSATGRARIVQSEESMLGGATQTWTANISGKAERLALK